ncbi:hypothetical protein F4775DRAFT_599935 [Biscogniauxia sp. FL1348]|nr:hypothetical protein F4775DRAFT_599935 [Biscogniauxia sp. FL1348]
MGLFSNPNVTQLQIGPPANDPYATSGSMSQSSSSSSALQSQFYPQGMGSSVRSREAAEFVASMAKHFDERPRLSFIKHLGIGRHGGTMLFERLNSAGQVMRKIVIKYSLGNLSPDVQSNADDDLRNEFKCLAALKGAEHIGQLVYCADTSLEIPGVSDGDRSQPAPGDRRVPTIALEYIPNGTAFDMTERMIENNDGMPSRFLWRVFLCLVRQCIAMAFPPRKEWRDPLEREQIIPGQEMYDMIQCSNHLKNVMFGDIQPEDLEHRLCPTVKLIDFGRGARTGSSGPTGDKYASSVNLLAAAEIIAQMVFFERPADSRPPVLYRYTDRDNRPRELYTIASRDIYECTSIDLELRDLMCRCYASDSKDSPDLQEALEICEWQVRYKTAGNVQANIPVDCESDAEIRSKIQLYILNAPIS